MNIPFLVIDLTVAAAALVGVAIAIPRMAPRLGPRFGKYLGEAYQKRFLGQLKKKYPAIAERFGDLEPFVPEKQEKFASILKKIPPTETMKLQQEFMRLRDGLMGRHPELAELLGDFQSGDSKRQAKALQSLLRFKEPKRQALSKDLLWAVDQFQGRFPKWSQALLGSLRATPDASKDDSKLAAAKPKTKAKAPR